MSKEYVFVVPPTSTEPVICFDPAKTDPGELHGRVFRGFVPDDYYIAADSGWPIPPAVIDEGLRRAGMLVEEAT